MALATRLLRCYVVTMTLESSVLMDQLREAARLVSQQGAELEYLRSQKRSLLATVTDLQALVRLLSLGRLAIVKSEEQAS